MSKKYFDMGRNSHKEKDFTIDSFITDHFKNFQYIQELYKKEFFTALYNVGFSLEEKELNKLAKLFPEKKKPFLKKVLQLKNLDVKC